ncbi:NADPH:quinone reductase [Neisseria sp. Ec49-e6-T10]|uniref:NADPH:quinone reductase n=1 Tax=Neisseria sp. Ec49-e6-T10 TaxID=3140744 RepID=UPI003EBFBE94
MTKHIEFNEYGSSSVLQYVPLEIKPPMQNEVQVQNKAVGVNFIDTYIRSGLYPVPSFPSGLGTEASGIVTQVGQNVADLKVGDRVVYAQATLGAYSDYHNVNAEKVIKIPDSISFEQAAASFLKGLTVYYLFYLTYPVKKDEVILFHAAAGGVGQIACQWARALGVKLIGTAGSQEKVDLALQKGAWQMINYQTEDIAKRVSEITEGEKVNVVYDSVGQATWLSSLDCLKPRGLMVSFGNASGAVTGVDLGILNQKGSLFVTRPSLFGYLNNKADLQKAATTLFELILNGSINVDVRESQIYPLSKVKDAHNMLESRKTMGSLLLIPESH